MYMNNMADKLRSSIIRRIFLICALPYFLNSTRSIESKSFHMNRGFVPLWPIERRSYGTYLLIKGGGRGSAFEEPPNFQVKSLVYCRID